MRTIVYILLFVAALIGIIAVFLFATDESKSNKTKAAQLEKAREAKAEKKLIRELESEMTELTKNTKSDASEKN